MFLNTMRDRPLVPSGRSGLARKNHLSIFGFAHKIEITAFVVDPGLLPLPRGHVEDRNTLAAKMHSVSAGEILFDDAPIENAPDAIRPVRRFTRVVPRPGQVPFAYPEIQLLLLGLGTRFGLCRGRGVLVSGDETAQVQSQPRPAAGYSLGITVLHILFGVRISLPSDGTESQTVASGAATTSRIVSCQSCGTPLTLNLVSMNLASLNPQPASLPFRGRRPRWSIERGRRRRQLYRFSCVVAGRRTTNSGQRHEHARPLDGSDRQRRSVPQPPRCAAAGVDPAAGRQVSSAESPAHFCCSRRPHIPSCECCPG